LNEKQTQNKLDFEGKSAKKGTGNREQGTENRE
jgi:hypothetical protein